MYEVGIPPTHNSEKLTHWWPVQTTTTTTTTLEAAAVRWYIGKFRKYLRG